MGASGGGNAVSAVQILDCHRHAIEWARHTRSAARIGLLGCRQRLLTRYRDIGVERRDSRCGLHMRPHQLGRRHVARGKTVAHLHQTEPD